MQCILLVIPASMDHQVGNDEACFSRLHLVRGPRLCRFSKYRVWVEKGVKDLSSSSSIAIMAVVVYIIIEVSRYKAIEMRCEKCVS